MKTRIPIFVGWTKDEEKVILYSREGGNREYHLKVGDSEVWALPPGTEIKTWMDRAVGSYHLRVISTVWTGSATGTQHDAKLEEAI